MDTIITPHFELPPPAPGGRIRWTRDHCEFLEKAGILTARYELIDGEIILGMTRDRTYARMVMQVIAYLSDISSPDCVQAHAMMEVAEEDRLTNHPDPDVVLLRGNLHEIPAATDVLLAVEISGSTSEADLGFKRELYARAGVAEYWVVDVEKRILIVFRNGLSGIWHQRLELSESEPIAPLAAPERTVTLSEWLPPQSE